MSALHEPKVQRHLSTDAGPVVLAFRSTLEAVAAGPQCMRGTVGPAHDGTFSQVRRRMRCRFGVTNLSRQLVELQDRNEGWTS